MRATAFVGNLILLASACAPAATDPQRPRAAVNAQVVADELRATDSTFAARAADRSLPDALADMFAADVAMGVGREYAYGKAAAVAALRANADNATSRISWTPLRVGVSSDGLHGFTQGYLTISKADGSKTLGKYLGYWVKGADGWRLSAYKRVGRPAGEVSLVPAPHSLPLAGLPGASREERAGYLQEIRDAESAFSKDAGLIGMGPAFLKWGAPDAMNLGAGPEWARGPEAISKAVGGMGQPGRRTSWGADSVRVAATGDLGVAIGFITHTFDDPNRAPTRFPFFTVWKRARPGDPWRYVAE